MAHRVMNYREFVESLRIDMSEVTWLTKDVDGRVTLSPEVETTELRHPEESVWSSLYGSQPIRFTGTAEQLSLAGAGTTAIIEMKVADLRIDENFEDGTVAMLGGYTETLTINDAEELTFQTNTDFGRVQIDDATNLSFASAGHIRNLDTEGNRGLAMEIMNGRHGNFEIENSTGYVLIDDFQGGDLVMEDIPFGIVNIRNGSNSDLNFQTFAGAIYTQGDDVTLDIANSDTQVIQHRGDESAVELHQATTDYLNVFGEENDVDVFASSISQQLTVGTNSQVDIAHSSVQQAAFGLDTEVNIDYSRVIATLEGENKVTIANSSALIDAQNDRIDFVELEAGARMDGVFDSYDMIDFGATQWRADELDQLGTFQVGETVSTIGVTDLTENDGLFGLKG